MDEFIPIHIPTDWSDIKEVPSVMELPVTYVKWIIDLAKTLNYIKSVSDIPSQLGHDYEILTSVKSQLFWKKISEFPNAIPLSNGDNLLVEQLGQNRKISISDLTTLITIALSTSGVTYNLKDGENLGGIKNNNNLQFTTLYNYLPNSTKIYLNGQRLKIGLGNDYIESALNGISFLYPPLSTDQILIDYKY